MVLIRAARSQDLDGLAELEGRVLARPWNREAFSVEPEWRRRGFDALLLMIEVEPSTEDTASC